jgi:hypothetical protein
MYETFPKMKSLHFETATGPTECIDLMSMEFKTAHFDGMAHVPSYLEWVIGCDMVPVYRYHRRVLRLLQWHCPPRLWHLKTPVHMLWLPDLSDAYPGAKFLWTHRDPADVLASVCSLIAYTRSWVSDRPEPAIGEQQVELWAEAIRRAMAFRDAAGEGRFADVWFGDLQSDPVAALERAYADLDLEFSDAARRNMSEWRKQNPPGAHGTHQASLDQFGLEAEAVRRRFDFYLERFSIDVT